MTEAEWLASGSPYEMLNFLKTGFYVSDRKLRLFTAACYWDVSEEADLVNCGGSYTAEITQSWANAISKEEALHEASLGGPFGHACAAARWAQYHRGDRTIDELSRDQANFLRDIVGNPWRPVKLPLVDRCEFGPATPLRMWRECPWLSWNNATIPRLAQSIYDERRFEDMPILADAMEEAGCTNTDIMAHLRGPGPHVMGCWVLDLILGKE